MILRRASSVSHPGSTAPQPAWPAFQKTQKEVPLPCFLITQPAHARLAGELATRLLPEAFGDLPKDVLAAIRLHDIGWEEADTGQIRTLAEDHAAQPCSFTDISPEISTEAWRRSIRHAESISSAAAILTSRHFCSLATDSEPHHQAFLEEETDRRRPIEERFGQEADLTRWLGALGFCDLLSLTLCSGHDWPVTIPLAHPNMPEARTAKTVTVRCVDGRLEVSPPVLKREETPLEVPGQAQIAAGEHGAIETFVWEEAGVS